MWDNMDDVICFAVFDTPEVFQTNRGIYIDEVVWGLQELVQLRIVLQGQKICGELRKSLLIFLLGKLCSHFQNLSINL